MCPSFSSLIFVIYLYNWGITAICTWRLIKNIDRTFPGWGINCVNMKYSNAPEATYNSSVLFKINIEPK